MTAFGSSKLSLSTQNGHLEVTKLLILIHKIIILCIICLLKMAGLTNFFDRWYLCGNTSKTSKDVSCIGPFLDAMEAERTPSMDNTTIIKVCFFNPFKHQTVNYKYNTFYSGYKKIYVIIEKP